MTLQIITLSSSYNIVGLLKFKSKSINMMYIHTFWYKIKLLRVKMLNIAIPLNLNEQKWMRMRQRVWHINVVNWRMQGKSTLLDFGIAVTIKLSERSNPVKIVHFIDIEKLFA